MRYCTVLWVVPPLCNNGKWRFPYYKSKNPGGDWHPAPGGDNPKSASASNPPALVSGWHLLPEAGCGKISHHHHHLPTPKKNEEKTSLQPLRDQFDEAPAIQNKNASLKSEIQLQNLGKKKHLENLQIQVEIPTWSEKIRPFSPTLCVFVRQKVSFHPWLEHLGWFSLQYLGPGESACVFFVGFYGTKMDSITRWWVIMRGICWTL